MDPKEICSHCQDNCCQRLIFTGEYLGHPEETDKILAHFPFFEYQGSIDVPVNDHFPRFYICRRYNFFTHLCQDYDTVARPPFCEKAGVSYKPVKNCRLFNILHPTL